MEDNGEWITSRLLIWVGVQEKGTNLAEKYSKAVKHIASCICKYSMQTSAFLYQACYTCLHGLSIGPCNALHRPSRRQVLFLWNPSHKTEENLFVQNTMPINHSQAMQGRFFISHLSLEIKKVDFMLSITLPTTIIARNALHCGT